MDKDLDLELAAELAEGEADRQRKAQLPPALTREAFLAWRSPRTGGQNPTPLDHPLWHWLVRTRWSAYRANEILGGPSSLDVGPMWCFDRFGQSKTLLPDGRTIYVGGEHEDFYDSDFFIYNDVVVVSGEGSVSIYGYPLKSFQPTDFHSATLVNDAIIIIGCLGYPAQRAVGSTPVWRLNLGTLKFTPVRSSGNVPGWIFNHSAALTDDGNTILVSGGELWRGHEHERCLNVDDWSFNVARGRWTRLTTRDQGSENMR